MSEVGLTLYEALAIVKIHKNVPYSELYDRTKFTAVEAVAWVDMVEAARRRIDEYQGKR